MDTKDTTEKKITFIQYAQPQLQDGNYEITVTQTISSKSGKIKETSYPNKKGYTVSGERFSLDPADIVSVFPPAYGLGEYSNVLPHVVLNRKTLPWERSAGHVETENNEPWIGLLVFDEGDDIPKLEDATLIDLLPIKEKTSSGDNGKLPADIYFPEFPTKSGADWKELDYGEHWTDACQIIDVDVETFNSIAPSAQDLGWLAHVREVEIINKSETYVRKLKVAKVDASDEDTTPKAPLAEVVANRFPLAGKKSTVHLVSFESYASALPSGDTPSSILDSYSKVRLVSLKSWSFTAVSEKFTFSGLLLNVNKPNGSFSEATLKVPFNESGEAGDDAVSNALEMGFAAFNHRTRMGDKTVSWYRGPFTPYDTQSVIRLNGNTSDDYVHYNPDTGMFDVSYASAWELGRLLALQNGNFSTTLYNWKRELTQTTIRLIEDQFINLSYTEIAELIAESLGNYVDPIKKNTWNQNRPNRSSKIILTDTLTNLREHRVSAVKDIMKDPQKLADLHATEGTSDDDVPYVIANFLARLKLLYGIPFNYLVSDVRMLPLESLRFFYMDTAWANALVEGALSIGRSTSGDSTLDKMMSPHIHGAITQHAHKMRSAALGIHPSLVESTPEVFNPTGFLLRSQVVSGWPGLEVVGKDKDGTVLPILRFEHAGPDVLLCIFNGVVQDVAIHEHPEALHFGVDIDPDNPSPSKFMKSLRYITQDGTNEPGSPIPPDIAPPLKVKDYVRKTASVLEVDEMAKNIGMELKDKIEYTGEFTSAEFALEMIEGVQQVTFKFNATETSE